MFVLLKYPCFENVESSCGIMEIALGKGLNMGKVEEMAPIASDRSSSLCMPLTLIISSKLSFGCVVPYTYNRQRIPINEHTFLQGVATLVTRINLIFKLFTG